MSRNQNIIYKRDETNTDNGIDLNISNYDLNDILKLFNIEYDFSKEDLKMAKKTVLMMHPDKSNLDKEYFLFFSSAYKLLYKIYEFRHKITNKDTDYKDIEKNHENELLLEKLKDTKNFNRRFNTMFESMQLENSTFKSNNAGYGDWFASNDDIDTRTTTKANMNLAFETKKREVRDLVVKRDFSEYTTTSGLYDLTNDVPETYSADMFSKLQYEDLKKAHTETVIPVTNEDYINRKQYSTINELQTDRGILSRETASLTHNDFQRRLEQKKQLETKSDIERAFTLAKQEEDAMKANNNWWSKLKVLTF
jgi:hypothetical protein